MIVVRFHAAPSNIIIFCRDKCSADSNAFCIAKIQSSWSYNFFRGRRRCLRHRRWCPLHRTRGCGTALRSRLASVIGSCAFTAPLCLTYAVRTGDLRTRRLHCRIPRCCGGRAGKHCLVYCLIACGESCLKVPRVQGCTQSPGEWAEMRGGGVGAGGSGGCATAYTVIWQQSCLVEWQFDFF